MTMGRLKYLHLVLMLGISIFIPLSPAFFLSVDLSETVLPCSDMSFEDADDEDSSTCDNELKVFVPTVSFNLLPPWTRFGKESSFLFSPFTLHNQITPILRC